MESLIQFRRLIFKKKDLGDPLYVRLLRGGFWMFFLNISAKFLSLLSGILLARWLGVESFGIYTSVLAVITLLNIPATRGIPTLIVRLMASYKVTERWGFMRGLLFRTNQVVLFLSIITAFITFLVVKYVDLGLSPEYLTTFNVAFLLMPILAVGFLTCASLRGLDFVVLSQIPEKLVMPGLLITLLAIWHYFDFGQNSGIPANVAISFRLFSYVAAFGLAVWWLTKRLPKNVWSQTSSYDNRYWLRSALPLLFIGGTAVITLQTDVFMLAMFKGAEEVGIYRVASRVAEMVAFTLGVVNMVIEPTISSLYTGKKIVQLQEVLTKSARLTLLLAIPSAVFLVFYAESVLSFVFGQEYIAGATPLIILCFAQLVNAGAGSAGKILNMTGFEKEGAWGMGIGAVLNILLNLILIPKWGVEGAAIGTGLSLIAWNVILVVFVRKRVGLDSTIIGKPKTLNE